MQLSFGALTEMVYIRKNINENKIGITNVFSPPTLVHHGFDLCIETIHISILHKTTRTYMMMMMMMMGY